MAKFTFGAGNARVLLRAPLYLAGMLASRIVPRDDRLWVFGSGIGLGEGALALYRHSRDAHPSARLVWLGSTDAELAEARWLGMTAASKRGWRGFRLTLRARVIVVTHGFGDVNRFGVPGAFVVQLWHGIPLKRLHLDTPAALRLRPLPDHPAVRRLLAALYRRAGRQISMFTAASGLSGARLASAFGLRPGTLAVTGDPRDDVLLRPGTGPAARELVERAVGPLAPRVVLYAPTWRDGAPDPGLPTDEEWEAIAACLERTDSTLLVRPHPLGVGDYLAGRGYSPRIRMLDPEVLREVMPALPAVDVLVTDYSSIAFDYSLLDRPIVFFAPDLGRYESGRGLYEPYRAFSGGTHVTTWSAAIDLLEGAPGDARLREHVRALRAEHFDFVDDGSSARVLDEILRRLRGGEADAAAPPARDGSPVARPVVDLARVEAQDSLEPVLVLGGTAPGGTVTAGRLVGSRLTLEGQIEIDGDRWTARIPLAASRWGGPRLAPPSGAYRLQLSSRSSADGDAATSRVAVETDLPPVTTPLFRLEVSGDGTLDAVFSAPLADHERGAANQRRLRRRYLTSRATPEPAVFFESFYSQVAACNPSAIDARLAVERPDVVRYWSTVDASVEIPRGSVRLIEGSADWWRVRASARLLIVNDWLRSAYLSRGHQRVLQTWHGTMLKRLALDRPRVGARTRLAVLRERGRWDILLAQNEYSAAVFRSAYRFHKPIWVEGYPRDDALAAAQRSDGPSAGAQRSGDSISGAEGADDIRSRLGLAQHQRVVLYAPTWRDDRTEIVDYLDLDTFADELDGLDEFDQFDELDNPDKLDRLDELDNGEHAEGLVDPPQETVVLVRGHSRTLRYGRDLRGTRVIDVTTYPDITDLLLVADILITDYSSLMFDFTATGKPIIFFTPDIRHYSDHLRGFYFDLHADAPGPVVETQAELVAAVHAVRTDAGAHAARYAAWRARFNALDDGHAAARVVRRIVDEGLLD